MQGGIFFGCIVFYRYICYKRGSAKNNIMFSSFRKRCWQLFNAPSTAIGRFVNNFIAILIILSISVIPFYFVPQLEWTLEGLFVFEIFVTIIFSLEYLLRAWSSKHPFRYIFSWFGIIDFISILPFYLEVFGVLTGAHYFLVLRISRILKLGKIYYLDRASIAEISKKKHGNFCALENEYIERLAQKHPVIFFISLLPPLLFTSIGLIILTAFQGGIIVVLLSILCFISAFLFFLKAWIDFHYDVIYITNHRIILQNRQIFGTKLNDIVYEAITNIRPDNTGIIRFLFGFGDIYIETAAKGADRKFTHASDALDVVHHISLNRKRAIDQNSMLQKPLK
jgi:hypothetical protein